MQAITCGLPAFKPEIGRLLHGGHFAAGLAGNIDDVGFVPGLKARTLPFQRRAASRWKW